MIRLPKPLLFSVCAAILLLFAANLRFEYESDETYSQTSFGVGLFGYKAAYDLLSELGLPVSRSYRRPGHFDGSRTLWLVSPDFLKPAHPHSAEDAQALKDWIRHGGTAVVFGEARAEWKLLEIDEPIVPGSEVSVVRGEFTPHDRRIPIPGLLHFKATIPRARVRLTSGDVPFAIEIALGDGHLLAVADDRFMLNSGLDKGDSSLLLVDFVRALGAPVFDERYHGYVIPGSSIMALVNSRGLLPVCLALMAAMLWIAERRIWPSRKLPGDEATHAPSIVSFVESLGTLYARSRDPRSVFLAYRAGFMRRLRGHVSLQGNVTDSMLIEKLARVKPLSSETRHWLDENSSPATEHQLVSAIRALEACPKIR